MLRMLFNMLIVEKLFYSLNVKNVINFFQCFEFKNVL